jgi:hypothetical protein
VTDAVACIAVVVVVVDVVAVVDVAAVVVVAAAKAKAAARSVVTRAVTRLVVVRVVPGAAVFFVFVSGSLLEMHQAVPFVLLLLMTFCS